MKKTSNKIRYILKHGFTALFAFGLSMALGVSGFTQLLNLPSEELNTELLRLDGVMENGASGISFSACYLFIGFSLVILAGTLFYIKEVCKSKA